MRIFFLLAIALWWLGFEAAFAQTSDGKKVDSPTKTSAAQISSKKAALVDATRVSTERTARTVARAEAQKTGEEKTSEKGAESAVVEFQPAPKNQESTSPAGVASKASKKSALKNVHGTAYGSLDSQGTGTRSAGAAAGANSKSGKTYIYVESERSRTTPPK